MENKIIIKKFENFSYIIIRNFISKEEANFIETKLIIS